MYKPMLYSTPMVQATLAGRKHQTRRTQGLEEINKNPDDYCLKSTIIIGDDVNVQDKKAVGFHAIFRDSQDLRKTVKAKYGVGDVIWVREALHQNGELNLEYKADKETIDENLIPADFKVRLDKNGNYRFCDIPNIFMEKCFARLFLEVTNVRIERLADVSDFDARAEGIEIIPDYYWTDGALNYMYGEDRSYHREYFFLDGNYGIGNLRDHNGLVASFLSLFASVSSWEVIEKNPWVWVYEFKKIEKPAVWPS